LHLAVHGFADTQYPERSALVLGADPKSGDDGLLQVREIIRLRLNAELTTLSACDTGVGKLQGQEGISNLVKAFLVAGSKSVVASLWSADDTSASAITQLSAKSTLTNGNAYTAAVLWRNVQDIAQQMRMRNLAQVAVLGCTGSVGAPLSRLLVDNDFRVVLIGRRLDRVRALFRDLAGRAVFAEDMAALKDAEIVVVLTNDDSALIHPHHVRPGTIIIDSAQPANIPLMEYHNFRARSVSVVQGGLVKIPGYYCTYDFDLPDSDSCFACLAETYLFAREGIREHSAGRPSVSLALRLDRAAERHSIVPLSLKTGQPFPDALQFHHGSFNHVTGS